MRIYRYINTPAPLKIATTPAPITKAGVGMRMFREVVFFESLFKGTKWTWMFSWMFHVGLALVILRHLRYAFENPPFLIQVVQPFGVYAGFIMAAGLLGLLGRRIFVDRIRYISAPSDYLMLIMLIFIGISGLMMKFVTRTDVAMISDFFNGLWTFSIGSLPLSFPLVVHLSLVALLMIIFPFSKLLHVPGIFFSPSRNMPDNPREQRHVVDWAKKLEED
jgi:nitrate reductase gamma subunit